MTNSNSAALRRELIEFGRRADARDWVPAGSGNFSCRDAHGQVWVTVSGQHKGRLADTDFLVVDETGQPVSDPRMPSAETLLHCQLYQDENVQAVLHTHSAMAVAASLNQTQSLIFRGLEILKAFPNENSHETSVEIPIFENSQDMRVLANEVDTWMSTRQKAAPAYLIRGHGLYSWGHNIDQASRQIDALEHLFHLLSLNLAQSPIANRQSQIGTFFQ